MSDIKIFVSSRIDLESFCPNSEIYVPVQCGAIFAKKPANILGDNTGANISERRMSYCELTVQYWAWKNMRADYMGLCHYRRFLNFSSKKYVENSAGQVMIPALNPDSAKQFGLTNEDEIKKFIESYDAVVLKDCAVKQMPTPKGYASTVRGLWDNQVGAIILPGAVDLLMESIKQKCPQMYPYAIEYMASDRFRGYNCFVMRKALFDEFCGFEFTVLFDVEKKIDYSAQGNYSQRTCGYLGEILFSIFIYYLQKNRYKVKEVELLVFEETALPKPKELDASVFNIVAPIRQEDLVPAVLFTKSLSDIAEAKYTITFLAHGILPHTKRELIAACKDSQVNVDFYDPTPLMRWWSLDLNHVPCYFWPLFSPWLFTGASRIAVISVNSVFLQDITDLFSHDLGNRLLAAVTDIDTQSELCDPNCGTKKHLSAFGIEDLFGYYDDSVLLVELNNCRKKLELKRIIYLLCGPSFCRHTKDFWNLIIKDDEVLRLSHEWNIRPNSSDNALEINWYTPLNENSKREDGLLNPKIIVGWFWRNPYSPLADLFWKVARNSSVYERLVYEMYAVTTSHPPLHTPIASPYKSRARKIADRILPKGSRRRNLIRKVIPKNSRRWNFLKRAYYLLFKR